MDNILSLHNLIGSTESQIGFNNKKKFKYDPRGLDFLTGDQVKKILTGIQSPKYSYAALGDEGILYFDASEKNYKFVDFDKREVKNVFGTLNDYKEEPACYATTDGFIASYKGIETDHNVRHLYFIGKKGEYSRSTTIHFPEPKHYSHRIGGAIQDIKNRYYIMMYYHGNMRDDVCVYVYNSTGSEYKHYFVKDYEGIDMRYRNAVAHDGWIYGVSNTGQTYGKMNYMTGEGFQAVALTPDKLQHIVADPRPKNNMAFSLSQGKKIDLTNMMIDYKNNTIPMWYQGAEASIGFGVVSEHPNPENGVMLLGEKGGAFEVDFDVHDTGAYYAPANPNIRTITELFGGDGMGIRYQMRISPNGRVLFTHHGDYTSNLILYLYRR
ncbi:hypothetical protein [Clostridium botulinum]